MRRFFWGLLFASAMAVLAYDLSLAAGWWNVRQIHSRAGFTARKYADASGEEYGYVLFVPHDLPAGKNPALLVFLNGTGENGRDGVMQISNNFGVSIWETRRSYPMICVAPQCTRDWAPGSPDMQRAIALVDQLIAEYNVDPDRVYVTGVSAGGAGAWNFAAAYPGKFAAIVPVSGVCNLDSETIGRVFAAHDLAIWNFFNDGDPEPGLVANNREFRQRLLEAGMSPVFTEYHQNHHDAWNGAYRSAAMYDWLSRQNRPANRQWAGGARFRRLLADQSQLEDWQPDGAGIWTIADGLLRCDAHPSATGCRLQYRPELSDFELHFDYQSSSGAPCALSLESIAAPGDSIRVVVEFPDRGTGGVVHERSGEWLGSSSPLGQRALLEGRWNDIRLMLRGDRLQVHVNGAILHDVQNSRLSGKHRVAFQVASMEGNDRQWRFVRLRELKPVPEVRP